MARWLLKTEPGEFSYENLEEAGREPWDGVKNVTALIHLRKMAPGDGALIYHTGKERRIVGLAEVVSGPYPDPSLDDDRYVVVDVEARGRLEHPVPLAAIKEDPAFADFDLVRISRLSVMPVSAAMWKRILAMSRKA